MIFIRTQLARRHPVVLFILLTFCPAVTATAAEMDFPEAKVKAAYLFNFLRFVEWPADRLADNHICVIGYKKEYSDALVLLSNQTLNEKSIVIREYSDGDNLRTLHNCQIVFITSKASHRQKILVNSLQGAKVLTVGENDGFVQHGGMINFIKQQDRIRFEINLNAVNQSGLRITSKILRIAERVITGDQYE